MQTLPGNIFPVLKDNDVAKRNEQQVQQVDFVFYAGVSAEILTDLTELQPFIPATNDGGSVRLTPDDQYIYVATPLEFGAPYIIVDSLNMDSLEPELIDTDDGQYYFIRSQFKLTCATPARIKIERQ
jgi:hypothetical protein